MDMPNNKFMYANYKIPGIKTNHFFTSLVIGITLGNGMLLTLYSEAHSLFNFIIQNSFWQYFKIKTLQLELE